MPPEGVDLHDQRRMEPEVRQDDNDIRRRLRKRRGVPIRDDDHVPKREIPNDHQGIQPPILAIPVENLEQEREPREDFSPPRKIPIENQPEDNDREVSVEFDELLALMDRLGFVCSEPSPMAEREARQAEVVRPMSRSAKKRKEYAKTQNLYSRDKAAALKYIVDRANFVEHSVPSREVRRE